LFDRDDREEMTRLYDPAGGHFTSRDVLFGETDGPASMNQYGYGEGSPVTMSDPTGMKPCAATYVCLYADSRYRGRKLSFRDVHSWWRNLGYRSFSGVMSSVKNTSGNHVQFAYNADGTGTKFCYPSGAVDSFVGRHNDKARAMRIQSGATC